MTLHSENRRGTYSSSRFPSKAVTRIRFVSTKRKLRDEPFRPSAKKIKAAGDKSFAVPPRYPAVMPVEVADPYGEGKIVALRSVRDDPLGSLHAHRQIDDHPYEAGRL